MKTILLAAAAAFLLSAPAFASDETEIMAVINKMNDALTKNDMKTAGSTYAANASIIDEFPPHFWSGADAFSKWGGDFATDSKKHGDTDGVVTTSKPLHVSVDGDRGYAVVPATFTFKEKGKTVTEHALWTFAMDKSGGDWKIAGWAWGRK
jgi:ketosteroid isomerase-like protein